MSLTSETMTPADIAAVTGHNNNGGLFGDGNGAWFLIILFLFAFMGWGGGYGMNGGGTAPNYTLASDFATIQRQLSDGFGAMERKGDSISNGLCDGFYAQNSTLLNGFAGVQQGMNAQGYETRNAIQAAQVGQMQNANAIQMQMAQCCCDGKAAIADLKYTVGSTGCDLGNTVERGFADTGYAMATNTNAIVQSTHADTDRIIARIDAMETARQAERITQLQNENQGLRFAASQQAQNAYLVGQLRPAPVPAFTVPNPWAYNGCGCNTCGC